MSNKILFNFPKDLEKDLYAIVGDDGDKAMELCVLIAKILKLYKDNKLEVIWE